MPGSTGPNVGFTWGYSPGEDGWGVGGFNPNWARTDTLLHLAVNSVLNTPPGTPVNGERYIVGDTPTGDFVGHIDEVAVYLTIGTPGWVFYSPKNGWKAWNIATGETLRYNGSAWIADTVAGIEITAGAENDILQYSVADAAFIDVRPRHTIGFGGDPDALLTANQVLLLYKFPVGVTFIDNFGDYRGWSTVAQGTDTATADVVLSVEKAEAATPLTFSAVGTLTIGLGGAVLTAKDTTGVGDLTFAKNDVIRIRGPATADATFKGLFGTLVGFET